MPMGLTEEIDAWGTDKLGDGGVSVSLGFSVASPLFVVEIDERFG